MFWLRTGDLLAVFSVVMSVRRGRRRLAQGMVLRRQALAESPDAFGATLADWSGELDNEPRWRQRLDGLPVNLVVEEDGSPVGMVSVTQPVRGRRKSSPCGCRQSPVDEARAMPCCRQRASVPRLLAQVGWSLNVRGTNDHAERLYRRQASWPRASRPGLTRCIGNDEWNLSWPRQIAAKAASHRVDEMLRGEVGRRRRVAGTWGRGLEFS